MSAVIGGFAAAALDLRDCSSETDHIVILKISDKGALTAHIKNELVLSDICRANPPRAAIALGLTFSLTAAISD